METWVACLKIMLINLSEITNTLWIGRNPNICNVVIDNESTKVSGLHCILQVNCLTVIPGIQDELYSFEIFDKSRNGTLLNGMRLISNKGYVVEAGDVLNLAGQLLIHFV